MVEYRQLDGPTRAGGGGGRTAPPHSAGQQPPTYLLRPPRPPHLRPAAGLVLRARRHPPARLLPDDKPHPPGGRARAGRLVRPRHRTRPLRLHPRAAQPLGRPRTPVAKPFLLVSAGRRSPLDHVALRRPEPGPRRDGRRRAGVRMVERASACGGSRPARLIGLGALEGGHSRRRLAGGVGANARRGRGRDGGPAAGDADGTAAGQRGRGIVFLHPCSPETADSEACRGAAQ